MYANTELIAHVDEFGNIQTVREHLLGTAERAKQFAEEFGCGDIGFFTGLYHDIGKCSEEFQTRIRNPALTKRVDHSTAGAVEAARLEKSYLPMAMAIAGHHSGLMDFGNAKIAMASDGTYLGRMKSKIPQYDLWKQTLDGFDLKPLSIQPVFLRDSFSLSFFTRMLFSCLVDGDYLDTEAFMMRGKIVRGNYDNLIELLHRFEKYVEPWLTKKYEESDSNALLCKCRSEILQECMEKGESLLQGLFTLTVPTGGGKTTASMGVALKHACKHGMKRIIYVIPYTSIIDQNADVFKKIFGDENVIEHHSGILFENEEGEEREKGRKALAVENWDAPIIITTAVQFFESLFANKSSKCRKLHNLSNSVIVFDEAQTLPVPYLEPCIAAIAQLVKNYRSTVVLCTATQPALDTYFHRYIPQNSIDEISSKSVDYFPLFERTTIQNMGMISRDQLENDLRNKHQTLCIVNRRKTAQDLYSKLNGEGVFCLTTLLCPADRKKKIQEIRDRLFKNERCIVIATSLVEAGVDLDFPSVYRQEAGLDSLIQAAGRCNREGKRLASDSFVYSFQMDETNNKLFEQNISSLRETWRRFEKINTPEAITFYFQFYRDLLGEINLDQKRIMEDWTKGTSSGCLFPFEQVAKKFSLIESATRTIYISVPEAKELIRQIDEGSANRDTYRRLGQYCVNVHDAHFNELWNAGCLDEVQKELFVLRDMHQYNNDTGLKMDVEYGQGFLS